MLLRFMLFIYRLIGNLRICNPSFLSIRCTVVTLRFFFFNFRLPFLKSMLIFTSRTEGRQVQQSAPGGYETILGFCCALSSPYGHYKNFSGSESESESIFCFPQSGVGNRWKKLCVHSLTCSLSYNWQKRAQKHIEKYKMKQTNKNDIRAQLHGQGDGMCWVFFCIYIK